jgi:hypothetical protein
MPSAQEDNCRTDYRIEALVCAARTCASVTADLLSRHPKAAALQQYVAAADEGESRSLSELLWLELVDEERACLGTLGSYYVDPAEGAGVQYWRRRIRLSGWKQRRAAAGKLAAPWPKILEMPSPAARQLCVAIGTEMVTRSYAGLPLAKVVAQLGPLGTDVAGQVIERLRRGNVAAAPPAVAERWRDAYARVARDAEGERLVYGLGRSLLAALYRRLPQDGRRAAAGMSRSKLPEILEADEFLEPVAAEELILAQAIATALAPRAESPALRAAAKREVEAKGAMA